MITSKLLVYDSMTISGSKFTNPLSSVFNHGFLKGGYIYESGFYLDSRLCTSTLSMTSSELFPLSLMPEYCMTLQYTLLASNPHTFLIGLKPGGRAGRLDITLLDEQLYGI